MRLLPRPGDRTFQSAGVLGMRQIAVLDPDTQQDSYTTPISHRNTRLNFPIPTKFQAPKKFQGWVVGI